jgi:hypothetical protein
MPESAAHKRAKNKAAGASGKTEVPQKGGTKLDAQRSDTAIEVERSGNLAAAVSRLKKSPKPKKVLIVPQPQMPKARQAMRKGGLGGTVSNMSGTKKSRVPKP